MRTRRGRQPEARRNDQSLLRAARLVFAVHGPEASVSAVAAVAGVGIASLYRRYATKEELLQHLCQVSMDQQVELAAAALSTGGDPWENLAGFIRACVSDRAGAFGTIAGAIAVTDEMIATARRANQLVTDLVHRAQRSGSLRQDVNSVDIFELIALFSRRPTIKDAATARLLEIALDGLREHRQTPLSGPSSSWTEYVRQWSYQAPSQPDRKDPLT